MNNSVVLAEKTIHRGVLHSLAAHGGEAGVENGFAFRVVKLNDNFSTLQVVTYGKGVPVKTQTWKPAPKPKPVKKDKDIETKNEGTVTLFED